MAKKFISFGFFALLVLAFASCSRLLRPTTSTPKKQRGGSMNEDNTATGNSTYDTSAFKGKIIKNIAYKKAVNYQGSEQQLALDIYQPANAAGKKFPVVILVHGGSFVGGNKEGLSPICSRLANNGYITVSINYRLGWGFVSKAATTCADTVKLKKAMYRAVQDTHSAIDYLVAHADEYNIDTNWMFLGGRSAGAITALAAAYLNEKDVNAFFPDDFVKELGPLYNNNLKANYNLKGVISMWGAFLNPELITADNALPTIFFQGELDKAVPFRSRTFTPCPSASMVYGTYPLYNRLKALGETAIAHVDPQGGHGVFEEDFRDDNILCFLNNVRQGVKKQVYLTGVVNSCDKQ